MHGTSRPCLRGTVEGLMNAAGLDEPITRRPSLSFLSKNHSLTFTMIRTPSYYGRARGGNQYDDGNGKQKHDWGLRGPIKASVRVR